MDSELRQELTNLQARLDTLLGVAEEIEKHLQRLVNGSVGEYPTRAELGLSPPPLPFTARPDL
jgi:hypothetical protein